MMFHVSVCFALFFNVSCVCFAAVRHLQSLPDQIKPHSVLETRLDHMEQNRNFSISGDYQRVLNAQGLFSSFQHEHSEYGVEKLIAKRERAEHLAILEKFGRPAMLTGSNLFKMKYEEQFPGKDRPPRASHCFFCLLILSRCNFYIRGFDVIRRARIQVYC
jgi:hypothetical protein